MRHTKIVGVLLALCAACAVCAMAGCSSSNGASAGEHGITVSASSETKVVPDKARVSIAIVTEEKEAQACQEGNAKSVNAVIEALKGLGLEEKSIQTSYSNLSPRYGTSASANGKAGVEEMVITGYEMTTELSVSDLDIDNVGAAVQACVAAGANRADGIQYYASNYDEVYNQALAEALATAKSKAEGIASATGATLGKVVSVTEGYQDTSARYVSDANSVSYAEDAADGASVAKTMPGQVGITANVTVTYAI